MIILILVFKTLKIKLKPFKDVIVMENYWPEEELILASHQLISMLNIPTQVYQKVERSREELNSAKICKCM